MNSINNVFYAIWQQGLRQWRRHWRMAESRLLFLALLVSVTAVSSVTFFTDRSDQAMQRQASKILGGDLVVQSTRPLPPVYQQHASTLGIQSAAITSFPSMIRINDASQLVQIRAASTHYPLLGSLSIATTLDQAGIPTPFSQLQSGHAWAEPSLFAALGIQPGATVQLGQSTVKLSAVIRQSPDQGASVFEFMPQVLIAAKDLPATGLLTPASRAKFSLFLSGDSPSIQTYRAWLEPRLQTAETIRSLDDGLPSMQQALQRGQRFLSLAALLSVILAGVAIALTSYSLSQRETATVAILKTLGASRKHILLRYTMQLFLLATSAALIGIILGFLLQYALVYLLQDWMGEQLPAPGGLPVLSGLLTAWVMVLGFAMPQLTRLVTLPPVHILQRHRPVVLNRTLIIPILALVSGMWMLIWLQVHDTTLSMVLLAGLLVILAGFWLVARFLLWGLQHMQRHLSRPVRAFLNLPRANFRIALLIMVFGVGFFSLLLLTALRTDLIERWQATLPEHAPNYFLINIQPHEVSAMERTIRQYSQVLEGTHPQLYPMTRGRLTHINGQAVVASDFDSRRARGLLDREANLSTAQTLPPGNTLTQGHWFKPGVSTGLSIEAGIAHVLRLKLGDILTFDIAGEAFRQPVTSFRTVRWDNMQPNFFILAAPGALQDKPRTYMTSLYVDPADQQWIPALIRQYPSISAINISTVLSKIKTLIDRAAFAVQTLFLFTLLSGITVLFAALQSQKAERRKEIAILKSMGASHAYLRRSIISEFMLIGAIAGLLAASLAMLVSNLLAYQLFDLNPALNPGLLLTGMTAGALLVGTGGYLNVKGLFQVSPKALFQEQ